MKIDTDRLRGDAEAEFAAAKEKYEAAIRSIEAIERIASNGQHDLFGDHNGAHGAKVAKPSETTATTRKRIWDGIRPAIRLALDAKPEGVTVDDVDVFIQETFPGKSIQRKAISLALSRMYRLTNELRMTEKAVGSKPATYARAEKSEDVRDE